MKEKNEDESLKSKECMSEESKLPKRKITYTRICLLSLYDWETCCDLPSDFDSSILQELYDDGSNGTLERPSSSEGSEYGLSQSLKFNDQDLFEKFTKWDGNTSWQKNKDSYSERNSNTDSSSQKSSRKLTDHLSGMKSKEGHSRSNQESDDDKYSEQKVALYRKEGHSRSNQESDYARSHKERQLKKCDNPYRPPHMFKGKVKDTLNSGKDSPVTFSSEEQRNEKQSPDSNQTSKSEAINKSEVRVDQENKFTYPGDEKLIGMNLDKDYEGIVIKELPGCAAGVKSGNPTILSKNPDVEADSTLGMPLHHSKLTSSCIEDEKGSSGRSSCNRKVEGETNGNESSPTQNHRAKEHKGKEIEYEQLNSADSAAFSERGVGFSHSPHFKEMESGSNYINQNTRGTEALKPTSGMDFLKEYKPCEPVFSIQIGSFNLNAGQDSSDCSGPQIPDLDNGLLLSILDDSGAFEIYSEIIKARKASMESKENEHGDENENEDPDYRKIWDKISSFITTTEQYPNFSLSPDSSEIADFNEICLPDEDSLITIDDLISPLSLEPPNEHTSLPLNPTTEVHAQESQSELSYVQAPTAPPHIVPRNNIPPPKPNLPTNTVFYSILEQPGNLVQQPEGATVPDQTMQLGCYNNGPCATYFYPHLPPSYQMSGRSNTDLGGGGSNSLAIVNGSAGPMHPLATGYGHIYQ